MLQRDVETVVSETTLTINNAKQEALLTLLALVKVDPEAITQPSFKAAIRGVFGLSGFPVAKISKRLVVTDEIVEAWFGSDEDCPTGEYAAVILRTIIEMAQAIIRPCAFEYQYPGCVVVGDYVLPPGMPYDASFTSEILRPIQGRGYITMAAKALNELHITTIGAYLSDRDAILKVSGVGRSAQSALDEALRAEGVRWVGEKMLAA